MEDFSDSGGGKRNLFVYIFQETKPEKLERTNKSSPRKSTVSDYSYFVLESM